LARLYLADKKGVRDIAMGIFYGGLVYVPLCLWEIRMSPQLHMQLYGYHQHSFLQTMRTLGGYRPMVFMQHGLMVGTWMAAASLVGVALWRSGALKRVGPWPAGGFVLLILATTIMCQSLGALILLAVGITLFAFLRRFGRAGVVAMMIFPVAYCGLRVGGHWNGGGLVDITRAISEERADSLQYRLEQEEILSARAWERPALGWGGFNRAFPTADASDLGSAVSDSLWVVVFGMNGLLGLVSIVLTLLAPIYALTRRWRPERWTHPDLAPAGILAILLGLYLMDGMVNMMINPVFTLAGGALTGLAIGARAPSRVVVMNERPSTTTVTS
jgi:O-antigen ligase